MGLFDSIAGMASSALAGAADNPNAAMLQSVIGALQHHEGGLGGLLQQLQQGGLGEAVSSWIGSGHNLPVSAEQLQSVLGDERIAALAAKVGISPDQLSEHLSQLLPQVVDKLTPGGQAQAGGFDLGNVLGMLQGALSK
jgi:uncharacterized protein YidB (DUF937 family)